MGDGEGHCDGEVMSVSESQTANANSQNNHACVVAYPNPFWLRRRAPHARQNGSSPLSPPGCLSDTTKRTTVSSAQVHWPPRGEQVGPTSAGVDAASGRSEMTA